QDGSDNWADSLFVSVFVLHIFVLLSPFGVGPAMPVLILNPSAYYLHPRAQKRRFSAKIGMLHFRVERAAEWYIPFVNTKNEHQNSRMAFAEVRN
ncbi:MAG: hypothetical protein CMB74_03845, partial [Euryarchaeota archaeon]|nr:hypothetical protein [Euryarchaeota archaeon]